MPRTKKTKIEEEKIELFMASTVEQKTGEPKKIISAKLIFGLMLAVVFFGAISFGGYFYWQYKKVLQNPTVNAQSEIKSLTEKIGKFVDLPTDEDPTIAEVKDTEKLKGQLFFSSAQNGDKVLIYSKNKKAVLYRPATNKVVEVTSLGMKTEDIPAPTTEDVATQPAPVENASEEKPAETPAPVSEEKTQVAKVVVYNGTKTKGLAGKLAKEISAGVTGVEISETGNATGNYSKTIVIDLSANNPELVQKIVSTIGGEVGAIPSGEIKPDGDILVIGGEE